LARLLDSDAAFLFVSDAGILMVQRQAASIASRTRDCTFGCFAGLETDIHSVDVDVPESAICGLDSQEFR
jgi:hypothetical protein